MLEKSVRSPQFYILELMLSFLIMYEIDYCIIQVMLLITKNHETV